MVIAMSVICPFLIHFIQHIFIHKYWSFHLFYSVFVKFDLLSYFFVPQLNNSKKNEIQMERKKNGKSGEYFMSVNNLPYAGFIRQAIIIITARPNLFMYILNCHDSVQWNYFFLFHFFHSLSLCTGVRFTHLLACSFLHSLTRLFFQSFFFWCIWCFICRSLFFTRYFFC